MCTGMQVFFLVFNFKKYFEKSKMKKDDFDYFKGYPPHYEAQPKYIKLICGNVSDGINSQIISLENVKMFIINHYIFNDDQLRWSSLKVSEIVKISELYSLQRYEKDKKFLVDLAERLKPKTVFEKLTPVHDKLYKINADGKNYLYSLVINNYVGPPIFAHLYKKGVFTLDESKLDERMFRFVKAVKQITNTNKEEKEVEV